MITKESLLILEELRNDHLQLLKCKNMPEELIEKFTNIVDALDEILCELRMMPEKKSESGTNSKEIVISFPAGFDLKAIRDAKLLVRYYKGNDEYSFLTETFALYEKSKEE